MSDKKFVRFTHFNDTQNYNRQPKRNNKKSYTQKSTKGREPIKQFLDDYKPYEQMPLLSLDLIKNYPKFFNQQPKAPEKDTNENMNDYVIIKKTFVKAMPYSKKQTEPLSQSDPDWNSDDDNFDVNLQSKKIDSAIIAKVIEGDKIVKKQEILKRHEKQFLEEYFRTKREEDQQKKQLQFQNKKIDQESKQQQLKKQDEKKHDKEEEKQKSDKIHISWSDFQEKQASTLLNNGFLTKVQENEEEIAVQVVEDDMFGQNFTSSDESQKKQQSSDQQDDDIFGDQHQTTKLKKVDTSVEQSAKQKTPQGTVLIKNQIYNKIAQSVGVLPAQCIWIITDSVNNYKNRYKMNTAHMDQHYMEKKLNEVWPYICLNNSEFVHFQDIETPKAMEIFKNFNSRQKFVPKNRAYKQKTTENFKSKNHSHQQYR